MKRLPIVILAWLGLFAGATPAFSQDDMIWRQVEPANLVFMDTTEGEIIIELNPVFAPETVARFKELSDKDFYRALSFYRVIDGFVAQAGDESDITQDSVWPGLPAEFERAFDKETMPWTRVQRDDLFAPETGFIDGFAAAREDDKVWLTHCPGTVAMARGNEANSGSTDFYIVIGQAPRYLDRNLTVFGRVIDGLDVAQRFTRGKIEEGGIIADDLSRSRIRSVRVATSFQEDEGAFYYVMDTNSRGFRNMMEERRKRSHEFFIKKPPRVLDVCQVPVASRREKVSK